MARLPVMKARKWLGQRDRGFEVPTLNGEPYFLLAISAGWVSEGEMKDSSQLSVLGSQFWNWLIAAFSYEVAFTRRISSR